MFDIGKKISRAWYTVWNYKVLWIFAFLLALAGGSTINGGGGGGGGTGYRSNTNPMEQFHWDRPQLDRNMPSWMHEGVNWFETDVIPLFTPDRIVGTIIWTIVILFAIGIVVNLLLALVRYPTETSLMRMVDQYETDGSKMKFKPGWSLGWNVRAFRIWVIDLIIGAPGLLIALGFAIGGAIFALNAVKGDFSFAPGMIGLMILAGFLVLLLAIVMIFVGLWRQFIVRAIAIDGASIGEGFKQGWAMMAHNFKNAFLTWLVMLGLRIGFGIAFVISLLVLLPAMAIMMIPGAVVGAIPGAIAFGITSIFSSGLAAWIVGGLVGLIFFFTVVGSPATLVSSWFDLFASSIWTQTYREMKAGSVPPVLQTSEVVPPPLA
ncbi:MAG: hypothetical protein CVU42_01440 [Chloroflexi bacterium HGW-Chloroflexi-4]|nr:MAG: hypothetical protein CVU42_01440 [Chloroflexi bacterium HGW-Chloroflexi-4]